MQKELFQGTAKNAPLTPKEASEYLGFSIHTLQKWRNEKKLPEYSIHNKRIWYRKEKLDEFLDSVWCPKKEF